MNHPKLLFIGSFLSAATGIRSIGEELSIHLRAADYEVITTSAKPDRIPRLLDMIATIKFKRKLYDIAVVEVYSGLAFCWSIITTWLLKLLKKKIIITLHGGKLPEFSKKYPLIFQKFLNSVDVVTTPSKYLQESFQSIRPSILYIPNGIEINNYPITNQIAVKPSLVWLRAFHSIYSPALAIDVVHILRKEFPDISLTMIGPDKGDGSIERAQNKVKGYGLNEKVKFTGAIPKKKVGKFLASGNIFLNTTNYESFGVGVLEAAACGLCIVTTNVGELPYLWENGVDALLVPPNDPKSMAVAVKQILEEPELAEKLSRNARKKAEQYDWSVILPQWVELIQSFS